ncbi:MAG TPA: hypothetical protein VFV38_47590, partial [Ktedonobacteraceae bacterium]|nr:hypothetical protein [Ktedonobacteraceae bacterium]
MRQIHHKGVSPLLPLLLLLTFFPVWCSLSRAGGLPVKVAIDLASPAAASQFSPGFSYVDTSLDYPGSNNDPGAVGKARALLKGLGHYVNTSIMGWGVDDPWPDPTQSEPTNWSSLDKRMQLILTTGSVPVITLAEAPWWMKGQLQSDGKTRLLRRADEWTDLAYSSRVLDNKMGAWLHLVQRVAERYMVPPYNVRYFQVWNELKGYYDPQTNAYDYSTNPGNPGAPVAQHGYTYMYNHVYERLTQVAESLHIAPASIKVGGPYIVMDTWSSRAQSNPSTFSRAYGTYDQRTLDVVQYWLQHKVGAGFITLDGGNRNEDNRNVADPFIAAEKFADVTSWIKTLDNNLYPGARTLPIWWAEWYASPYATPSDVQYDDAVKTYAIMKLIEAGGAVALSWGSPGNAPDGAGLWTPTVAGGGQPLPWYFSLKAFNDYFPTGTELYHTTVSLPEAVEALASAKTI